MTTIPESTILALADRHSAYSDAVPAIRGRADVLAFAADLLELLQLHQDRPARPAVSLDGFLREVGPRVPMPRRPLDRAAADQVDEQCDAWAGMSAVDLLTAELS